LAKLCSGASTFVKYSALWILLFILSGFLGFIVSYKTSLLISNISLFLGIITSIVYLYIIFRPRLQTIKKLHKLCQCPTYWPRKYSFICKIDDKILCYNYVTGKYYYIITHNIKHKIKITTLTPIDYYCVKYLGGKIIKRENLIIYNGDFENLTNEIGIINRGTGIIISGDRLDDVLGAEKWVKR